MLRFAVGKEDPACAGKGSFQVWISSPDGEPRMVYGRDLEGESGAAWIEEQVDLCEYAGRRVTITFRTEDASSCCSYLWADPVVIARKGVSAQFGPIVSGVKLTPSTVRASGEFEATFFGPALTPETYFDLRVTTPDGVEDQVVVD